jgi:hypothetical protein
MIHHANARAFLRIPPVDAAQLFVKVPPPPEAEDSARAEHDAERGGADGTTDVRLESMGSSAPGKTQGEDRMDIT